MSDTYDIVIIGGGMVGLSLAAALGQANFSVAVIESKTPDFTWKETDLDGRVSAIHLGTQAFLKSLTVWPDMSASCYSPLERMEVWDAQGSGRIVFDAADIKQDVLGYIVENREIVRVLWEYCLAHDEIHLLPNTKPEAIHEKIITCEHGRRVTATLIVGADGAHSWLRQQMKIDCREKPYHHQAIVAVIETEKPHVCTAYQPFLSTGPLGVLPLSHPHRMAIVWSTDINRFEELQAMSSEDFDRALTNAWNGVLGTVHVVSPRHYIPLIQRHAKQYIQGNKVLLGDAAHTIHPLAGQGANLGFMDAACLAKVVKEAKQKGQHWQSLKNLRRFERWRKSENTCMLLSMSGFQTVFASHSILNVSLRSLGMNMTQRFPFLKRYFMQYAVHKDFP